MTEMREGMDYCRVEVSTAGEHTIWDIFNYSLKAEYTDRKQFTNYSPSVQMTYEMGGWRLVESSEVRYVFERASREGVPAKPKERNTAPPIQPKEFDRMEEGVEYCRISESQSVDANFEITNRTVYHTSSVAYYDRHSERYETIKDHGSTVAFLLQKEGWILYERVNENYYYLRRPKV